LPKKYLCALQDQNDRRIQIIDVKAFANCFSEKKLEHPRVT